MAIQIKKTNTFSAYDEEGREYTIFEFTEYHEVETGDRAELVEGLKELRTEDGLPVTRIEKGVYHIIDFEEIEVKSDDSHAS